MNRTLAAVLMMAAVTLFTRVFPFLLFSRRKPPERLIKGARLIPGAVMTVLVLTSLPLSLNVSDPGVTLPWIAAGAVVFLHLFGRNALISIFGGTAFYMILLHLFG